MLLTARFRIAKPSTAHEVARRTTPASPMLGLQYSSLTPSELSTAPVTPLRSRSLKPAQRGELSSVRTSSTPRLQPRRLRVVNRVQWGEPSNPARAPECEG